MQLDALADLVRTQWTAAALRGGDVPPLHEAMEEARDSFEQALCAEPVEYDPQELAIRTAFRLNGR